MLGPRISGLEPVAEQGAQVGQVVACQRRLHDVRQMFAAWLAGNALPRIEAVFKPALGEQIRLERRRVQGCDHRAAPRH